MTIEPFVVPTMDCEPPNSELSEKARSWSGVGPGEYGESTRSMLGFMTVCEEFGLTPTYFLHPEVVANTPETVLDLRERGACLGLHLHPYKLNTDYEHAFGHYSRKVQRTIIEEALAVWNEGIEHPPKYFRAGGKSINDHSFALLEEMGFEGGSTSQPGYVNPERCINWAGAELYPHRAHHHYRQGTGDGEFIEIPYLPDFTRPRHGTKGRWHQGYERLEVKPDGTTDPEELRAIAENIVELLVDDSPDFPVVMPYSHNNFDYADMNHDQRSNLVAMFEAVRDQLESRELASRAGTIATVVEEFLDTEE